jgi:PTH1 family peptidyl-tRNA hydrolase
MISLVAFLGNFGKQYAGNRHNVAWLFSDTLSLIADLSWQKKFKAQYTSRQAGDGRIIHFIKPETFMNLSGESIQSVCSFFKLKPEDVLVIHDELELPLGTISLKWAGGLGGHNGLRSTNACLGTPEFWRLRFGIGRPEHPDVAGYVLSDFTSDERITLSLVWETAGALLGSILEKGPEPFLKEWAKKKIVEG